MARRTVPFFVAACLLAGAGVAQTQGSLALRLAVLPDAIVQGLSPIFVITVSNPAEQPQTLAGWASLDVTTTTDRFEAEGIRPGETRLLLPQEPLEKCDGAPCLKVPAHGQRNVYVTWLANEFFADRRLSVPGVYQLQLTLFAYDGPGQTMLPVKSNMQTLTVRQATGADVPVWLRFQQITGGKGWGMGDWAINQRMPHVIEANDPASTYAAWLAGIDLSFGGSSYPAALAEYDRALAANLPRPIRDEKLLEKGGLFAAWSEHSVRVDRNADLAVSLADQARPILTQVRDTALVERIRNTATHVLSELYTRESALADVRSLAEHDPPAPARVIPRVDCVTKGQGHSFSARFGYTNPNRAAKVLQLGGDNLVSPAPVDQGQPRMFKPGSHSDVFAATSPGGNLKWHLDGGVAEAPADFSVPCTSGAATIPTSDF